VTVSSNARNLFCQTVIILDRIPGILTEVFHDFPQSLQANSSTVS
jgi:hypothetical protein